MSLDDSERNYRSEVGDIDSLSSTGVRTRKEVSAIIRGGIPAFYLSFLKRRGIGAKSEKLQDNLYRISTINATRQELIKALESQHGVIVVDDELDEKVA